ncbi:argininosuccinate lyase [Alkalihalobacillus pseudalcaliphilus]|uniref:argininosuccinate lyase n=1 Tax=Alkalihalobacillus pseudalcaliphilus TaxID=79884 RepID=UPI00064DED50|nr:argininosuccinate lyase [Alkalihalobacillus pseudalcaliphilus]KMK75580.1 hypothetical protein AB990_09835 [Alkalihalobacillus pseudalcaliphilus]
MTRIRSEQYILETLKPTYDFTKSNYFPYMMEINLGHLLMLNKQNILGEDEAKLLLKKTYELYQKGYTKEYDSSYEDLFFMIEADLEEELGGELVGNMHIAFSRNDMDTTMFRMFWRDCLLNWMNQVMELEEVILRLVDEHIMTIMPAHTHNQQAQPTTLSHYLMAVEQNLSRDLKRAMSLYDRINESPMGACALSTTGFCIDRKYMCQVLGFDQVMANSYDAVATSDYLMEMASVLSISLSNLSRFVFDLIFMTTNEVNTLRLHDKHVQTSSIMPQKRNPSALEHTRASISKALADLQGCFKVAHNVPFGDIVDIGDDIQPPLLRGVQQSTSIIKILTEILADCSFNSELMIERVKGGFSTVTELSDTLVRNEEIPFRKAHGIVAHMVHELNQQGQNMSGGSVERLKEIAREKYDCILQITNTDFRKALNPTEFIRVRNIEGGPEMNEVKRQKQVSFTRLHQHKNWVSEKLNHIQASKQYLQQEVELFIQ